MAGSPVLDPLGANPHVLAAARLLTRLTALGIGGLVDKDCFTGGHNGLLLNPDFYTALAPRLDHWSTTGSPVRPDRQRHAPAIAVTR